MVCVKGAEQLDINREILFINGSAYLTIHMVCYWVKTSDEWPTEVYYAPHLGRASDAVNENSITSVRAKIN